MFSKKTIPIAILSKSGLLMLIFLFVVISKKSSSQVITGKVLNKNNEPIPYATIYNQELKTGTISNGEGKYRIQTEKGKFTLLVRSMGYKQLDEKLEITRDSIQHNFILEKQEFQLGEVIVFGGKEDPAVQIMRKAIANAPAYRQKIKHYEADLYIKANFIFQSIPGIIGYSTEINGKKMKEVFKEGQTYVIESKNKVTYDYPRIYKQEVLAKKSSLTGFGEPPVMELMQESFYENRVVNFISPLSPQAMSHYKFEYAGFIESADNDIFKIKITPKRKSNQLVEGYIYIVDKLWCIYNVDCKGRIEIIDVNFRQQYQNIGNQVWMPVTHQFSGKIALMGLKGDFNYLASLKYNTVIENKPFATNSNLLTEINPSKTEKPENKKVTKLKKELATLSSKENLSNQDVKQVARLNRQVLRQEYRDSTIKEPQRNDYQIKDISKDTLKRQNVAWDSIRSIPLSPDEIKSYAFTDSLNLKQGVKTDSISGKRVEKKRPWPLTALFGGKIYSDSVTNLAFNGIISLSSFDYNAVDGYQYGQKLNLKITPGKAKSISIIPGVSYSFNRKTLQGSIETGFTNVLAKGNFFQISAGKKSRDFKNENFAVNPFLNSVSTWFFAENYKRFYETRYFKLFTNQVINKNWRANAAMEYNSFSPLENHSHYLLSDKKDYLPNIPFGLTAQSSELASQKSFTVSGSISYTKPQRKPWLEKSPNLILGDYLNVALGFNTGIKNILKSVSDFSNIGLTVRQEANLTPVSGIQWYISSGYFLRNKQMHFSQFRHFSTSEILMGFKTFTNTFQLLNDYEPSTNKYYLNIGTEYIREYLLLRYISFINKKSWSESLYLNYLSTDKLRNYFETGFSINNLFLLGNAGVFCGFESSKFRDWGVKFTVNFK